MDFDDYKDSIDEKLTEKFLDVDGVEKNKYVRVSEKVLNSQWKSVKKAVDQGRAAEYISEANANLTVPDKPTPGRLNGLVKDHKPPVSGSNIPQRESHSSKLQPTIHNHL